MNKEGSASDYSHSTQMIDLLSRAIGNLTDPTGSFSIDYVEEKVAIAHYLLFKNEKKVPSIVKEKCVISEGEFGSINKAGTMPALFIAVHAPNCKDCLSAISDSAHTFNTKYSLIKEGFYTILTC